MNIQADASQSAPDPAAVLGAAISLWEACHRTACRKPKVNLSECYHGGDQCMREVMRVATLFEEWACRHIAFEEIDEVWPYFLENEFGRACIKVVGACGLAEFGANDCLRVAMQLWLPVRHDGVLPVPVLEEISNPIHGVALRIFRIQTVRDSRVYGDVVLYTSDDDPFTSEFSQPYFAFCGVYESGEVEHIADRLTYMEAVNLAQGLIPGLLFTLCPTSLPKPSVRRL